MPSTQHPSNFAAVNNTVKLETFFFLWVHRDVAIFKFSFLQKGHFVGGGFACSLSLWLLAAGVPKMTLGNPRHAERCTGVGVWVSARHTHFHTASSVNSRFVYSCIHAYMDKIEREQNECCKI